MATSQGKKIEEALETLKELEDLLTEQISTLHAPSKHDPNALTWRHLFIFYRSHVWQVRRELKSE